MVLCVSFNYSEPTIQGVDYNATRPLPGGSSKQINAYLRIFTRTIHSRVATSVATAGTISENLFKAQVSVNYSQFHEENLDFKFIT
jgi:hypothetical protein